METLIALLMFGFVLIILGCALDAARRK